MPEKTSRKPAPSQLSIPWWAWVFAAGCGGLVVGGPAAGAVGFAGAGACLTLARKPKWPVFTRVAACAAVTTGCYAVVAGVLGGIAMLTP